MSKRILSILLAIFVLVATMPFDTVLAEDIETLQNAGLFAAKML